MYNTGFVLKGGEVVSRDPNGWKTIRYVASRWPAGEPHEVIWVSGREMFGKPVRYERITGFRVFVDEEAAWLVDAPDSLELMAGDKSLPADFLTPEQRAAVREALCSRSEEAWENAAQEVRAALE